MFEKDPVQQEKDNRNRQELEAAFQDYKLILANLDNLKAAGKSFYVSFSSSFLENYSIPSPGQFERAYDERYFNFSTGKLEGQPSRGKYYALDSRLDEEFHSLKWKTRLQYSHPISTIPDRVLWAIHALIQDPWLKEEMLKAHTEKQELKPGSKVWGTAEWFQPAILPQILSFSQYDMCQNQVVSTNIFPSKPKSKGLPPSELSHSRQASEQLFGVSPVISASQAYARLPGATKGQSFAIQSNRPLDAVYLHGLDTMGYKVLQSNLCFFFSKSEPIKPLKGIFLSNVRCVKRKNAADLKKKNAADPLMFDLRYPSPERAFFHVIGECIRKAGEAANPAELHIYVDTALDWANKMQESGLVKKTGPNSAALAVYLDRLAAVKSAKLKSFGLSRYDLVELKENTQQAMKAMEMVLRKQEQKVSNSLKRSSFVKSA